VPDHPNRRVYLSSGMAAQQLGLSATTFRRAVKRGEIWPEARTPAGHARFSVEAVETFRDRLGRHAGTGTVASPHDERRPYAQPIGRRASDHIAWAQQEFLRALTDHFTDLVLIVDGDGAIKYASPSHGWILGYEPDQLLGSTIDDYLHPEDAASLRAVLFNVTPKGGLAWPSNVRIMHREGAWRVFEVIIRNRLADAAIAGIVLNALDVTDRSLLMTELQERAREADAMARLSGALAAEIEPSHLYTLILEHLAELLPCELAMIQLYRDGWVETAAMWGTPSRLVGTRLYPITDPPQGWLPDPKWATSYLPDTAVEPSWVDIAPWIGAQRIRSVIGVPFVINGEALGSLLINSRTPHFFTSRHIQLAAAFGDRVTQALRSARLFLAEQERARAAAELASLRSDFVASVSHELRTPLASIVGYAEALQAYWSYADEVIRRDWVDKIVLSANRQKRLVEDLLLLTVVDGGHLTLRREPVDLARVTGWAATDVRGSYNGQVINLNGPSDLDVLADPDRVQQVIANLLDNAAKYSPEGSPISVHWCRTETHAVLRVQDAGPGVPQGDQHKLFTRFGRLAGSPIRDGRWGTGLGLYLGRQLSEALGGRLELESTGPTGSVFALYLPIADPDWHAGTVPVRLPEGEIAE
jgi:PAS domain S-box-containing protein